MCAELQGCRSAIYSEIVFQPEQQTGMRLISESKDFGSCAAAQKPRHTDSSHSSEAIHSGPVIMVDNVGNKDEPSSIYTATQLIESWPCM